MATPGDIARILTKLQLRRRPDIDDDGMESWVNQKGRGNVEVSVSESGRWVIMWEEVRVRGFGLGQLGKKLIGILKQTTEGELEELTGTGGVSGFGTPYAFATKEPVSSKKKRVDESGLYTTPKDIAQALTRYKFRPDHSAEASPGPTVWELPRQAANRFRRPDISVEVDERKGTWTLFSGETRRRGKGGSTLGNALGDAIKEAFVPVKTISLKALLESDPYYGWRNDETQTPKQKIGRAISEINKQLTEVEKVVKRTQRLKKETGTSNTALWNRTSKSLMKIESRMTRISQNIRNMRG